MQGLYNTKTEKIHSPCLVNVIPSMLNRTVTCEMERIAKIKYSMPTVRSNQYKLAILNQDTVEKSVSSYISATFLLELRPFPLPQTGILLIIYILSLFP